MTEAERVLWEALRGRRLAGLRFRRQHPVGRFILDFYCPIAKLCVEVDGGIHDLQAEQDAERSAALAAGGYRVVRVRNEEVLQDLPSALARIEAATRPTEPPLTRTARAEPSPVIGRGGSERSERG
jgi:very-short-patch-repair endonuclease